jgi:FkbM family methyltransferase
VIEARNEAISDYHGYIEMCYKESRPELSSIKQMGNFITFRVTSIPLSEVIADLGWVDILKMDCEGCEHKALNEAKKAGELKHVGRIVLEAHSEVRDIIKLLRSESFKVIRLRQIETSAWILDARRID